MRQNHRAAAIASAGLLSIIATGAFAADFYQGKTLNMMINYQAGGPADFEGRIIAHHLGKHIPGNPSVVPQNQPGTSGIVTANRIYNSSEKDGTVISIIERGAPQLAILGEPAAKYDPAKFTWLGSLSSYANDAYILAINSSSPVKSVEDLRKTGVTIQVGAMNPGTTNLTFALLAKEVLGLPIKVVRGYTGAAPIFLAMQTSELDAQVIGISSIKAGQPALWRDGKLRALILDLRNNPGGLLDQAVAVSSDFIQQGEIVSTRARHPEDSNRWNAKGDDLLNGLPMVVLINNGSASASEIVAGALQDHRRAILLGTRSFGKGSVQTVIPLPGAGAMRLTTARYYTPSGRSIQGLGIEPEVPVRETAEEQGSFGGDHEADLNRTITNQGGTTPDKVEPRTDIPPIASSIPNKPPEGFPKFDPLKPSETDFQLQQGLVLAKAMADGRNASAH